MTMVTMPLYRFIFEFVPLMIIGETLRLCALRDWVSLDTYLDYYGWFNRHWGA